MPETTFLDSSELVLNMGPQHPSTHGVLRVVLKLDGEKVRGTDCVIGYLHRGVEKIGENRTWVQFAPYVDRMDYVSAVSNGLGYCLAIEKLLSAQAPPRAQAVRVILTELNRIASHLLWLGTHALDIGAITPLFYTMREREEVLKIFENYCGARLTTHAFRIGGLQYEIYDGFEQECKTFCDYFLPKVDEYEELLTGNRIWVERLTGVGILNAEDCKRSATASPDRYCARQASSGICANRSRTADTISTTSIFRHARTAIRSIATWCVCRRCGNRCESSGRRSIAFPRVRSWRRSPR
jgi:NADH-quinone oxidoreductase subunit D